MQTCSAITTLSSAITSAIEKDLPDVETGVWDVGLEKVVYSGGRPTSSNISVYHFPQTWSDTSLGFGGVGGQAFTTAYTTVVLLDDQSVAAVYFAGRLAYVIKSPNDRFFFDVGTFSMVPVWKASVYRMKGDDTSS